MKNIFLNLIILLVILYLAFWGLDLLFTKVYRDGDYTKIQWLYNIEGKDYDFALNGSSRAYTTVDIKKIEKETQLDGINISVDGSTITDQYLMLKLFLANNNTLDELYLQVDPWSVNLEEISPFAIPKFFPYLKEDLVFEHFKQFGPKWYAYRYIPFLRYAEYNTIWGAHQLLNEYFNLFPQDFDQHGCYFYEEVDYRGATELQDLRFELEGDYRFLNDIISLCKANNIKLTLFTAPVSNIRINQEYEANMQAFKRMMEKKGVSYVNFADIYGNKTDYFTDEIHLNQFGVKDFTEQIKNTLLKDSIANRVNYLTTSAARLK